MPSLWVYFVKDGQCKHIPEPFRVHYLIAGKLLIKELSFFFTVAIKVLWKTHEKKKEPINWVSRASLAFLIHCVNVEESLFAPTNNHTIWPPLTQNNIANYQMKTLILPKQTTGNKKGSCLAPPDPTWHNTHKYTVVTSWVVCLTVVRRLWLQDPSLSQKRREAIFRLLWNHRGGEH